MHEFTTAEALEASFSASLFDLDGDGIDDLVSSGSRPGTQLALQNGKILLGYPDAGFAPPITLAGSPYAFFERFERFSDGPDGRSRFVGLVSLEGLYLWTGWADGGFAESTLLDYSAESMAVGDFDGDGSKDILAASYSRCTAQLLSESLDGGFSSRPVTITASTGWNTCYAIPRAPADLNGDGRLDFLGNYLGDPPFRALQTPDGGFFIDEQMDPNDGGLDAPAKGQPVIDVNGDGSLDVIWWILGAYGHASPVSFVVELGSPDGGHLGMVGIGDGGAPDSVLAADISGDGIVDVIVSYRDPSRSSPRVDVFLGIDGGFAPAHTILPGQQVSTWSTGDINRDNQPDLIVQTYPPDGGPARLVWVEGPCY